jgi:hypothetical protein
MGRDDITHVIYTQAQVRQHFHQQWNRVVSTRINEGSRITLAHQITGSHAWTVKVCIYTVNPIAQIFVTCRHVGLLHKFHIAVQQYKLKVRGFVT